MLLFLVLVLIYHDIRWVYFSLNAHLKKTSLFTIEKKSENQHTSNTLTQAIYSISCKTIFTSASITSICVCTSSVWWTVVFINTMALIDIWETKINNQVNTSIYQLQLVILAKLSLALIGQCGHWFQLTLRWWLWSTWSQFMLCSCINDLTLLIKVCVLILFWPVEHWMDDVLRVTMVYQKWLNPIELSFEC